VSDNPIDVWVVEDNRLLRETVVELLQEADGIRVTLNAGTSEAALEALGRGEVPRIVLMDLGLPGLSGIEGIRRLKEQSPSTEVVVLTVHDDDDRVFEALCAGASGYLLKPAAEGRLVEAVFAAASGGSPMNAAIARKVLTVFTRYVSTSRDYGLTHRERELLELLVQEKTQKDIASTLFLSPHTVDTHLRNIYRKLEVHSRTGAVSKALRERLI